jgi:hypothetical protein
LQRWWCANISFKDKSGVSGKYLLKLMAGDVGSAEKQLLCLQRMSGFASVHIRVMKCSPFPVMDFERELIVLSHSTYFFFCSTADRTK